MKQIINKSNLRLLDVIKDVYMSDLFCPIGIYVDYKLFWESPDDIEDFVSIETCIENFKRDFKNYDEIYVKDLSIKIVQFHHSIISISTTLNSKED